MIVDKHKPGTFCWIELGSNNQPESKKFYTQLFDWTFEDVPMGPDSFYTMFKLDGKEVAALYQMSPEQLSQGIPSHWMLYISVESVDDAVKYVRKAGGTVLAGPFDVSDVGRMAVVKDPTGANFSIWQPKSNIGVRVKNESNAMCWHELATTDTVKAAEFYKNAFGWSGITKGDYTELSVGDPVPENSVGGMMEIKKEWGPIPPHWMVYFMVDDCDAVVNKAISLGATIIKPPDDIPEVGRFAVIQDPQGGMFSVIRLNFM